MWLKHLNPEWPASRVFEAKDVADPIAAATYWKCPLPVSLIEPYPVDGGRGLSPKAGGDNPDPDPDRVWDNYDPDGS